MLHCQGNKDEMERQEWNKLEHGRERSGAERIKQKNGYILIYWPDTQVGNLYNRISKLPPTSPLRLLGQLAEGVIIFHQLGPPVYFLIAKCSICMKMLTIIR